MAAQLARTNQRRVRDAISISGIFLRREGEHAVVEVEVDGRWVEICREHMDGSFSHIVEPVGIRRQCARGYNPRLTDTRP
jgi:hypothetical protein